MPAEVAEPFRSDDQFWRSVAASLFALVTLLAAAIVTGVVGAWGEPSPLRCPCCCC